MTRKLEKGDILLFRGGNNPLSKLIRKLTKSDFSHAGIYAGKDPDGIEVIIEATWGGVQMNPLDKYSHKPWTAMRHGDFNPGFWERMQGWLVYEFEKGYDYAGLVGIIGSFFGMKRNPFDDKSRYWCSEFVADAYLNSGLYLDVEESTWKVSPGDLWRQEVLEEVFLYSP